MADVQIWHTDAARTLAILKRLQTNTQPSVPATDPNNQPILFSRLFVLALETWHRMGHTLVDGDGSWLPARNFDVLDYDEWAVEIVDEIAAAAERKLKVWVRAVGVPFGPPTDE